MIVYEFVKSIGEFLWGGAGLLIILSVGLYFTVRFRFVQFFGLPYVLGKTLGAHFSSTRKRKGGVSPFATLCTALAASVGVGNIAGVSAALVMGGPGAVFWMVVTSFFGMMTAYAENYLGVLYRVKDGEGYRGGAMYYLRDGVGGRAGDILGRMFAFFCVMASFGMGNMSQVNALTVNFTSAFKISALAGREILGLDLYSVLCGSVVALLAGTAIFAGTSGVMRMTEKVVPFMVAMYTVGCLAVLCIYRANLLDAVIAIFKHAFSFKCVGAGIGGYCIREALACGVKRGVFSNEAGLGSTVCVGASADVGSPAEQGMWGMVNVFIDTVLMCTLTALTVLSSGIVDAQSGRLSAGSDPSALVGEAFSAAFGRFGGTFVALSVVLFAFSTVLGWSVYGLNSFEYLSGGKGGGLYRCIYIIFVFLGAVLSIECVFVLSDTFNALMMVPNLIGLIVLRKKVHSFK